MMLSRQTANSVGLSNITPSREARGSPDLAEAGRAESSQTLRFKTLNSSSGQARRSELDWCRGREKTKQPFVEVEMEKKGTWSSLSCVLAFLLESNQLRRAKARN